MAAPARIRRPTSTGTPPRASATTAGRSRFASRSPHSATAISTRSSGASCCSATTRATGGTVLLHDAAARRQLLHLPIEHAHGPLEPADGRAPGGGAVRERKSDGNGRRRSRFASRVRIGEAARRHRREVHARPPTTCSTPPCDPDFSQVEADTAQISANERFALFFPEKRPFFLEGVSLFTTPIQAVYTRSITGSPLGRARHGQSRQR